MKKILSLFTMLTLVASAFADTESVSYRYPVYNTDGDAKTGIKEWQTGTQTCTTVTSDLNTWTTGWYVVSSDVTVSDRITFNESQVNLILKNGCTLTAAKGIDVFSNSSLTIYAENETGTGALIATGEENKSGIGGVGSFTETYRHSGPITINGGNLTASGGSLCAGIGGGTYYQSSGSFHQGNGNTIIINGGKVTANGGSWAAGIGGGYKGTASNICINGGIVVAKGGKNTNGNNKGYAIGKGFEGDNASNIYLTTDENLFVGTDPMNLDCKREHTDADISNIVNDQYCCTIVSTPTQFAFKNTTAAYPCFTSKKFTTSDFTYDYPEYVAICGISVTRNTQSPQIVSEKDGTFYFCDAGQTIFTASLGGTTMADTQTATISGGVRVFATSGTTGATTDESPCYLFDGKYTEGNATKWCTKDQTDNYVCFETSEPVTLSGYKLYTANDNATSGQEGRSPKNWTLYGSNDTGDSKSWTVIDTHTDDNTMGNVNYTGYEFTIASGKQASYKYYKLDVTAKQGTDAYFQLGEMILETSDNKSFISLAHNYVNGICSICGDDISSSDPYYIDYTSTDYIKYQLFPRSYRAKVTGKTDDFNATSLNLADITYNSNTYSLYSIADNAFIDNQTITELTVKDGVEFGRQAFSDSKIQKLHISSSCTFGKGCFNQYESLTDLYMTSLLSSDQLKDAFTIHDNVTPTFPAVTLHIPDASLSSLTSGYDTFKDIVSMTDGHSLLPIATLTDNSSSIKKENVIGYRAGRITYSRNVTGSYASFCFPFKVKLSEMTGIQNVYTKAGWAVYNGNNKKLTLFLEKQASDATIVAGTPFLAKLSDGATSVTAKNAEKVTYDADVTANPDATDLAVYTQEGNSSMVYADNSITLKWCGSYVSTAQSDGMKTFNNDGTFGLQPTGQALNPYRAYIMQTDNCNARDADIYVDFGEGDATSIEELLKSGTWNSGTWNSGTWNLSGQKVSESYKGIVIINGKKVIK